MRAHDIFRRMRRLAVGSAILVAICVSACSGVSRSDDDDGGSSGETASSGKGGTGGSTGGTGNVGTGGGNVGGTGGGSVGGTGGGSVGGTGGGSVGGTGGGGNVGPSGVPSGVYLDELTANELHAICVWATPLLGGPGERQCDNDIKVTTPPVEECSVDTVTIHCKVALLEACVLSLNGDPCVLLSSTACAEYIACATGQ